MSTPFTLLLVVLVLLFIAILFFPAGTKPNGKFIKEWHASKEWNALKKSSLPMAQVVDYATILDYVPPKRYVILLSNPKVGMTKFWSDGDGWPHTFETPDEAQAKVDFFVKAGRWSLPALTSVQG